MDAQRSPRTSTCDLPWRRQSREPGRNAPQDPVGPLVSLVHNLCSLLGLSCLLRVTENPEGLSAKKTPFPPNMEIYYWLVPFRDGYHSNDKLGRGAGNNLGLSQVSLPVFCLQPGMMPLKRLLPTPAWGLSRSQVLDVASVTWPLP